MHPGRLSFARADLCTMQHFLCLLPVFVMILSSSAFNAGVSSRVFGSLQMSLQMETVKIPVQLLPCDYIQCLRQIIPEEDIIRWYIARIEDDFAIIEVVREKK